MDKKINKMIQAKICNKDKLMIIYIMPIIMKKHIENISQRQFLFFTIWKSKIKMNKKNVKKKTSLLKKIKMSGHTVLFL